MSVDLAQISFSELLAWNESEARKWREWFEAQPASVLNVPVRVAQAKNVREFLLHILAVELRYAQRLNKEEVSSYESLPSGSVAELFAIGDRARDEYRRYLARATDEELGTVLEFPTRTGGTFRASERKIFLHAMMHTVRHWAQLATALREAGHEANWGKDFLFSEVME
jgi:uncharacterized damage-inducible protein DinB